MICKNYTNLILHLLLFCTNFQNVKDRICGYNSVKGYFNTEIHITLKPNQIHVGIKR